MPKKAPPAKKSSSSPPPPVIACVVDGDLTATGTESGEMTGEVLELVDCPEVAELAGDFFAEHIGNGGNARLVFLFDSCNIGGIQPDPFRYKITSFPN